MDLNLDIDALRMHRALPDKDLGGLDDIFSSARCHQALGEVRIGYHLADELRHGSGEEPFEKEPAV